MEESGGEKKGGKKRGKRPVAMCAVWAAGRAHPPAPVW